MKTGLISFREFHTVNGPFMSKCNVRTDTVYLIYFFQMHTFICVFMHVSLRSWDLLHVTLAIMRVQSI